MTHVANCPQCGHVFEASNEGPVAVASAPDEDANQIFSTIRAAQGGGEAYSVQDERGNRIADIDSDAAKGVFTPAADPSTREDPDTGTTTLDATRERRRRSRGGARGGALLLQSPSLRGL